MNSSTPTPTPPCCTGGYPFKTKQPGSGPAKVRLAAF
nr:MAG TPA: hypothetical protein [Caudoviricetes sp.]